MSKILSTLAARLPAFTVALCCTLTLTVFTACSKSDNPVSTESGQVTIMTNNYAIYDQMGITDKDWELMSGLVYAFTDSVLVYDSSGQLVAKQGAETTTKQDLTFSFGNLPNGRYTLVILQSIMTETEGSCWRVYDEKSLFTANIRSIYDVIAWPCILGYATQEFTIDGNHHIISIVPKAMGSLIDAKIDHFNEDSGYPVIIAHIENEHSPDGMYLDPNLSDDDRWSYGYKPGDGSVFVYMTPNTPRPKLFTLAHGDDLTVNVAAYMPDGSTDDFYVSKHQKLQAGENYTFYFDLDRTGWQPPFLGSQEAFDTWKAERDAGILVGKPLLNWGCDFDEVMRYTQTTNWWAWRGEFAYSDFDEDWCTIIDVANEMDIAYMFETENGKNLRVLYVECFDESVPLEAGRKNLLAQGYRYCGKGAPDWDPRDISIFRSPDGKTEVQLYYYDDGGWTMFCYPNPGDVDHIVPGARAAARADFGQRPVPRRKGFMK